MLAHTNGQDIREANGSTTAVKMKTANTAEAFGINTELSDDTSDIEEVTDEVTEEVEEDELVEETFEL